MKILNFGSLNLDYVYQVEHFARPGETISALSQTVNCGGKGLNQSIALARAGAQVWHGGCVGLGGERLAALLKENGVDTRFLRPVDAIQGNAVIQVDRSGENCILLFGGSNRAMTSKQIEETLSAFGPGDMLVLQNEINGLSKLVAQAMQKGMTVVLNPSPFDRAIEELDLSQVSWLIMNEIEAAGLTGIAEPMEAWNLLHRRYPKLCIVITLGRDGSVLFTPDEWIRQEAVPVSAVDTTAAGDTFTGYFLACMAKGLSHRICMETASKAAAVSVTRKGAAASIPYWEEIIEGANL